MIAVFIYSFFPFRVFLYDEFLSTEECDGLMKAHNRHVTDLSKKDPIICFDSIETLRKHLKAARIKKKVSPLDFTYGKVIWKRFLKNNMGRIFDDLGE